jgi:uncharacterized protein YgiM (DUF1202 family)
MLSNWKRLTISLILLVILSLVGTGALAQSGDSALVRFIHAIPGASGIDIYTDGQLTVTNLNYGQATEYINFSAGARHLTVTQTGVTSPLWEQDITPAAGQALTMVVSSFTEPVAFTAFEDILDPLPLGKARFTVIHAISDAPPVDILLDDGRPVLPQVAYNQPAGTLDVPVFPYNMVVVPSGEGVDSAILSLGTLSLNSGASQILLLYGTAVTPQFMLLSQPTQADAGSAFIRFVHGVPGAPNVDVYVNDTPVANLTDPVGSSPATRYISVPAGSYSVALRESGTQQNLATATVDVASGDWITALAVGPSDDVSVKVLTDDLSAATANQAMIRVINGGPEGTTFSASLEDGTMVASNVADGDASTIASVTPSSQALVISGSDAENVSIPATNYYGGTFYNILAFGGDSTFVTSLQPVALAQGVASAPGAEALAVAAVPTATLVPSPAPQTAEQPTLPPPPTPTPVPVVAAPANNTLEGRVFNLDPSANLQLRQYPHSQALSLGVIPPGTTVTVNGREGEIVDLPLSATKIPDDYEYVDPVTLLEDEKADLDPAATWLFITYSTPDGGFIDAWARSDYIAVRTAAGEAVPLRNLPTVPGNTPGESRNTAVTGPEGRQDVVTVVVFNLAPGTNLNVRRTPENTGEVLAQLPLGTVAQFVGLKEDNEWIFLSYAAPDGSTITGWSSIQYLNYQLNGAPTTPEILQEKGLLATAADDERGAQTAGSAAILQPTVDPVKDAIVAVVELNAGANLNLRRNPTANAEVLAPIPSGTRLIVTERTGDGNWLHVTYEDVEGWIAARTETAVFVRLTFNDREFELLDVPIIEGEADSARFTPTPTLPPTLTPVPSS